MKAIYSFILLLVFSTVVATAQDTIPVSLSEILKKSESNNYQLKIAADEWQMARADYRQSNAVFLPTVEVSHTAIMTTNPLMAFGSKLNQEILTPADFNPSLLNDPAVTRNYATKVEVKQPLINVDGIYGRNAAHAKMQAYALQTQRKHEYFEFEVSKAYMQLQLAYQAVELLVSAVKTAHEGQATAENFMKQGYLQLPDLLLVRMHVRDTENQLETAYSNVRNASDYLAFLVGEDLKGKQYFPTDISDSTMTPFSGESILSEGRSDLKAMALTTVAYHSMMQSGKGALLPRVNVFGTYELYDQQLFGTNASGYLLGAQLSWNLFDGYASIGKYQKSRVEYTKSVDEYEQYKAQSTLELNKASRDLKDAERQVLLARLSVDESREAFRIRQNRFNQGLEKAPDLLQTETIKSQKELELQQAYFEYHVAQLYLQFLSR